jgi:predicted PP-loop superfamily ATPase
MYKCFDVPISANSDGIPTELAKFMSWYAFKLLCPIHALSGMIDSLHNHKGLLTITFVNKPTQNMMDLARGAWEECSEINIEFQYLETVINTVKIEADNGKA